jgi:hypothetical protein
MITDCKCGRIAMVIENGDMFKVCCAHCLIGTEMRKTSGGAIEAWNNGEHFTVGVNMLTRAENTPRPWYTKPILRELFWFLYLPWSFKQYKGEGG